MPVPRLARLLALALAPLVTAAAAPTDPYRWLEQVHGPRQDAWVAAENGRALGVLEADPRFAGFRADALRILEATDRVPLPNQVGDRIVNLWQDATNVQGLWRETTPAGYAEASPPWTPLLDLDQLSATDGVKWVWHGATCEPMEERRCLVHLSAGGEDAVTIREYDLDGRRFVPGGFTLPTSKQDVGWESPDRLLVARDWGPGTTTRSGYPFVVKRLARGAPLSAATEIYRGDPADEVGVNILPLVDGDGHRLTLIERARTFFEADRVVVGDDGVKPLALPAKMQVAGLVDDRLVVLANQDWAAPGGTAVKAGSLVAFDAAALRQGRVPVPEILFVPGPRQSVDAGVAVTAHHLIVPIYDNVRGQAWRFSRRGNGWTRERLTLPDNAAVTVVSTDRKSDTAFLSVESFLTPLTLWRADLASGATAQVKANPPRFDAAGFVTEQHEATSRDGTKIPYFIVHRRDARTDGSTPTLMTAYGGFQLSRYPAYLGVRGKLWLEHGGAFVLANIRGGGEFGPAWHEAGLKTKRQVIYDDFAAVGEDLVRRKLTSPRRLGIYGGSNGGLLMGVEMTQRPDLWHAVAIEIPLLDMLRYEQLSAGSSWVGEYGSVADPAVRAFWEKVSPYQALRRDGRYPEPFIWTTTKDDRVGPVQARKFAARMKEYGLPYLFWENTEGGHAAGANLQQAARTQALETTYFTRKLMD
jgi:prolyl oligopeptidase